eukprot:PITA_08423
MYEEQTGYVEGRQILDNIIQAHEVVHSLKSNKQAGMIIQLDLAKAYEKLSWSYIRAVLEAYGFDHNYIKWVMALATTASFSILLNGSPSRTFRPSRGLRQGDPLSPFLFILMMEGLGKAIKTAKADGRIHGLKLTPNGDALTHQQFVDDTMLQGTPTIKEAKAFKQILNEFTMATGTEVSFNKSKIFFFNTDISIQRNLTRSLSFQREQLPSKYLGIPLTEKPLSKEVWEPVTNKIQDKIRKWTCRSLNLAGRLVLIEVVLQTIPIFMFSARPAPKGVMKHIRNIQIYFLWGKGEEKMKWDLVAWDKICKPNTQGGLGLLDPKTLSKVLEAKLWWRWQKESTKNKGKWRIWNKLVYSDETPLKAQAESLAEVLEQRNILTSTSDDQLRWGRNIEGNFNLKEAKRISIGLDFPNPNKVWKDLWQNPHWMKTKLLMWLVQHKKIMTWENLRKRGLVGPYRCQLCVQQEETMEHLLNHCPFTSTLWNWVDSTFRQTDKDNFSITSTLKNWRKDLSKNELINKDWTLVPGFLIWDVWKERNNRIFKNKTSSSQNIIA